MAIAFNLPSEREATEENFSRLNRLLAELYEVLCHILVSRQPGQETLAQDTRRVAAMPKQQILKPQKVKAKKRKQRFSSDQSICDWDVSSEDSRDSENDMCVDMEVPEAEASGASAHNQPPQDTGAAGAALRAGTETGASAQASSSSRQNRKTIESTASEQNISFGDLLHAVRPYHSESDIDRPVTEPQCRLSASSPPLSLTFDDLEDDVFISPRTDNGNDLFATRNVEIFGYGSPRTPAGVLLSPRRDRTFTFPETSEKHWRDKGGTDMADVVDADVTDAATPEEPSPENSSDSSLLSSILPDKLSAGSICTAVLLMLGWKFLSKR